MAYKMLRQKSAFSKRENNIQNEISTMQHIATKSSNPHVIAFIYIYIQISPHIAKVYADTNIVIKKMARGLIRMSNYTFIRIKARISKEQ